MIVVSSCLARVPKAEIINREGALMQRHGSFAIVAQVDAATYKLISLRNGNRWSDCMASSTVDELIQKAQQDGWVVVPEGSTIVLEQKFNRIQVD